MTVPPELSTNQQIPLKYCTPSSKKNSVGNLTATVHQVRQEEERDFQIHLNENFVPLQREIIMKMIKKEMSCISQLDRHCLLVISFVFHSCDQAFLFVWCLFHALTNVL